MLKIVDAQDLTQEDIDRGISAANEYFGKHHRL
jgi:hypothetical protein